MVFVKNIMYKVKMSNKKLKEVSLNFVNIVLLLECTKINKLMIYDLVISENQFV